MLKAAVLLSLVFTFTSSAFADSFLPPCPYVVKSADGTKHFVMLIAPAENECRGRSDTDATAANELRKKYTASGVYENGDPSKPLWTFDQEWRFGGSYIANNGSHIVRMGTFGSSTDAVAFTIYKDGKPMRTYRVDELVRDESAVTYTTSMVIWSKSVSLDDRTSRFNVVTRDGISYSIDLNSGDIVRQEQGGVASKPGTGSPGHEPAETSSGYCFGSMIFLLFGIAATVRQPSGTKAADAEIAKQTGSLGEFLLNSPLRGIGDQLDLSRSKDWGRPPADTGTEDEPSPSSEQSTMRSGEAHK